jgi:phosphoserine phosphatase
VDDVDPVDEADIATSFTRSTPSTPSTVPTPLIAPFPIVRREYMKNTMRFPLVCFDLDGTLVDDTVYIWKTFHDHFRTDRDRRVETRQAFYEGKITYREWFDSDLELLDGAGADRESMIEVISSLPVMPGARTVLDRLRCEGRKVAIISGSVDLVVETLFPDIRFDDMLINRLCFDPSGRLRGGEATQYDIDRKADGLLELARRHDLDPTRVAFVGDNVNDVAVAGVAGRAIAFNCKSDALRQVAHVVVEEHDLTAILPHLD